MSKNKLKEIYDVESKYGSFYTGGNVEWFSENVLICQKETTLDLLDIESGLVLRTVGDIAASDDDSISDPIHTFTSNGCTVVTSHKSGLFKLWSLQSEEILLIKTWKSIHKGPVVTLRFIDENRLASGGSDGVIRLWDIKYQACTHSLRGCTGVINVLEYHQPSNAIIASADDMLIHSWNATTGRKTCEYNGHFSKVTSITFHTDGKHMITAGRDKVLILWAFGKSNSLRILPVFETIESVLCLNRSGWEVPGLDPSDFDSDIFVCTVGEKGIVRVWNVNNSKEVYTQTNSFVSAAKEEGGLSITKLLTNPVKKLFGIITVEHNIILHEMKTFGCVKQLIGFSDEILDVCFVGESDRCLAVATNTADIKLYNYKTMNCRLLRGHTDIVLSLAKSQSDLNLMLSSSKDNTVRLWKLEDNKDDMICLAVGARHTGSVGSVAFSHTSTTFGVSASQDSCVKVWKLPDLECMHTQIAHQKDINCVTISPNDKIIATAAQDKLCKLWTNNLELIGTLQGHKRGIWCVRFSPVDQVVLTSSADSSIKLWSISDLNCLKTFEGHDASVLKAEFLNNGLQILTAGADGLLKLFNIKTSECTLTLDQHDGRVWALAINSSDSVLVSGGSDSFLVKWLDVSKERRLEKIHEKEELILQEQQLNNFVQNKELLKALKLSLKLDRPFQTLRIIDGIIREGDDRLHTIVNLLDNSQKEALWRYASNWNMNSKYCQSAQLVLHVLLDELQKGTLQVNVLGMELEKLLPYTDRHFKRVTQLTQDLCYLNYTVNCMQPYAKKTN